MSKKSPTPQGSPQVHRERLSTLIKALKETKGRLKYDGIDYDLQGNTSTLNYKSFIQDVTGMSEGAFKKYESPEIEKNTAYSESGKAFKEPAYFIHSVVPYLTIDGGPENRNNSLHIDGAFGFKNNRPQIPAELIVETTFGPVAIKSTKPIVLNNVSQYYYKHIDTICSNLLEVLFFPDKISEIWYCKLLQFGKYIDEFKNEPDTKYEKIIPVYSSLLNVIKKKYKDLLESVDSTESILPGYKDIKLKYSKKQLGLRYYKKFKLNISELNLSDFSNDELIDFRYELMWGAEYYNYEYKDWPVQLKSLMLIVNLEDSSYTVLLFGLVQYLVAHTRFSIVSSSDGIKPIHRHNDYNISGLTDLLNEYLIDDFDKIFSNNLLNLISRPIHINPSIDRAKPDSLLPKIESHIHILISKLYAEKIENDLDISGNNQKRELLAKVLCNIKINT